MSRSMHRMILGAVAVFVLVAVTGCDDTRFVGVKSQVDTFSQDGEDIVDFFTQDGTTQVDSFEQSGFHQIDSFEQKASAEVDILWVVDNSASMGEEQTNLANNFGSFIAFINNSLIDYHIGVISTDMDNPDHSGKLQGSPLVIDRDTLPDPQTAFAANVMVGSGGGGYEMGVLAAHNALTEPLSAVGGFNEGFLRDTASLAVIFVSDEDDHSYGGIDYYIRFFSSLKDVGNENNVIVAAIVGDTPDGCDGDGGAARPGESFHELVGELGGTTASICADDFSVTLEQLGLTVAGLTRKFVLSREPDPGTVIVRVDEGGGFVEKPECVPNCLTPTTRNWRVELAEKAIYFVDYVPPPQAAVEVEYSNVATVFELSGRGDQSTLRVTVDEDADGPLEAEEKVENVDWWYDSDSNAIVFNSTYVPPLGSIIEVSYSDLLRAFALSREVENAETLSVEVDLKDGVGYRLIFKDQVTGWMYHVDSNSVLFQGNYVPPFGSELRITYSNLLWLFPLSQVPVNGTVVVMLDSDGDGPAEPVKIDENDDSIPILGYIYYDASEPAPYSNSVSFERIDWPPLGSVVTVRYNLPQ
jgi:hypothetical protein